MKQNFFDELDKDWGEVLVDTYKKYADALIYKDGDISVVLDEDAVSNNTIQNIDNYNIITYIEDHKDLYNKNYDIRMYVTIDFSTKSKSIKFGFGVFNNKLDTSISYISVKCGKYPNKYFNSLNKNIALDSKRIFAFIDNSCKIIQDEIQDKHIELELIEALKNVIKENTIDIL